MLVIRDKSELFRLAASGEKYGTVYVDPPWDYDKGSKKGSADRHYTTMSLREIAEIPVSALSAATSHLHLWTTTSFLKEALWLIDHWGFDYKSMMVWVKPRMGLGNYWRISHEMLLLGVRGNLRFEANNIKSWTLEQRGMHSEKPECFRQYIERTSPAPRLELFGRVAYPGWTVFGDNILGESKGETIDFLRFLSGDDTSEKRKS